MKHTKGKQKIEMKMVEDYEERMTTFSKRKYGIVKKMNEIVALCDAEASFLVFTQAGKTHTFAHPSMEDAVGRVKSPSRHDESSGKDNTNTEAIVEAYKRQENENLKKGFVDYAEELEMEEEKEKKILKELKLDKSWWNAEGLSEEEFKQKHQALVELHVSLGGEASQRGHYGGDEADGCD